MHVPQQSMNTKKPPSPPKVVSVFKTETCNSLEVESATGTISRLRKIADMLGLREDVSRLTAAEEYLKEAWDTVASKVGKDLIPCSCDACKEVRMQRAFS